MKLSRFRTLYRRLCFSILFCIGHDVRAHTIYILLHLREFTAMIYHAFHKFVIAVLSSFKSILDRYISLTFRNAHLKISADSEREKNEVYENSRETISYFFFSLFCLINVLY